MARLGREKSALPVAMICSMNPGELEDVKKWKRMPRTSGMCAQPPQIAALQPSNVPTDK
jgi:hypothetical protein